MYQDAMRKRQRFTYSPIHWWQNSSETERVAPAPTVASLQVAVSGSLGSVQGYTTVTLTTTEFTTVGYSTPNSIAPTGYSGSSYGSFSSSATSSAKDGFLDASSAVSTPTTSSFSYTTITVQITRSFTTTLTIISTPTLSTSATSSPISTSTSTSSPIHPIGTAAATSSPQTPSTYQTTSTSKSTPSSAAVNGTSSGFISKSPNPTHAAAVAGGIAGGITGLSLLFLLLLFLLRRHRRKPSTADSPPPIHISSPLPPTYRDSSAPTAPLPPNTLPTIEHNLIRMDLHHWDRPLVSTPPREHSPLRLMNPDIPSTPCHSSQSLHLPTITTSSPPPHTFLQRQRSALSAAFASLKRGISTSSIPTVEKPHTSDGDTSHLTIPSEIFFSSAGTVAGEGQRRSGVQQTPTPSPRSSQTIIRHRAPEDPFCVPMSAPREDFLAPPPLFSRAPRDFSRRDLPRANLGVSSFSQPQQVSRPVSPLSIESDTVSRGPESETGSPGSRTTISETDTRSEMTRFETSTPSPRTPSPTQSQRSRWQTNSQHSSIRSGPFDLATPGFVAAEEETHCDGCAQSEIQTYRQWSGQIQRQREETPNWIRVYEGT